MDFTTIKAITIPEGQVKKIERNGVVIWEEPLSYKNWVLFSTENDGKTIYNGGLGYKNGYRVRSGGAEAVSAQNVCTGFIPYKAGDVMCIYSPDIGDGPVTTYINASNASFANIGQIAENGVYGMFSVSGYSWSRFVSEANKIKTLVIPTTFAGAENIAFIRVSLGFQESTKAKGDSIIITVNEEITL